MKVGLVDVDSHNFPNLCLMKLSAYHKAQGDTVEWWRPAGWYDVVYKSRVFTDTYSKDNIYIANAGEVIKGGTGYGPGPDLPDVVEHSRPDYSPLSAVLRHRLRLSHQRLSPCLRFLHRFRQGGAAEPSGG